jgi:hypothetical protein
MIHENILYGYDYDEINNILIGRDDIRDYGMFSSFTLMLGSLMVVYKNFGKVVEHIDGKNILAKFKSEDNIDLYHKFFRIDKDYQINLPREFPVPFSPDDQHTIYSEEYINYYYPFIKKYFNFNSSILSKVEEIKQKYNIDPDQFISVVFRDSDKWTDFGGFNYVSAGAYVRLTEKIKEQNPDLKILIQSENPNVVTFFGYKGAISIEETMLDKSCQEYPPIKKNIEKRTEWVEYYIAALYVISQSKYVITYTGNSAFFVYLFRGTTNNLYQEKTFLQDYNDFFVNNN